MHILIPFRFGDSVPNWRKHILLSLSTLNPLEPLAAAVTDLSIGDITNEAESVGRTSNGGKCGPGEAHALGEVRFRAKWGWRMARSWRMDVSTDDLRPLFTLLESTTLKDLIRDGDIKHACVYVSGYESISQLEITSVPASGIDETMTSNLPSTTDLSCFPGEGILRCEATLLFIDNLESLRNLQRKLEPWGFPRCPFSANMDNGKVTTQANESPLDILHVSLDAEWRHPRPISLLQVAIHDEVFLLDFISKEESFVKGRNYVIEWLFQCPKVMIVGFGFAVDYQRLCMAIPSLPTKPERVVDLQLLALPEAPGGYSDADPKCSSLDGAENPKAVSSDSRASSSNLPESPKISLAKLVKYLLGSVAFFMFKCLQRSCRLTPRMCRKRSL